MINLIKIVLAVLLFICLLDMPYGYYELVRFLAMIGFSIIAYDAYKSDNQKVSLIFIVIAVLFQPFFKVSLGREIWNFVDVVVGIGLLLTIKSERVVT